MFSIMSSIFKGRVSPKTYARIVPADGGGWVAMPEEEDADKILPLEASDILRLGKHWQQTRVVQEGLEPGGMQYLRAEDVKEAWKSGKSRPEVTIQEMGQEETLRLEI